MSNELCLHWVNGSHPMKFWPDFLRWFLAGHSQMTARFGLETGQFEVGNPHPTLDVPTINPINSLVMN